MTSADTPATCTTGVISSATVPQITQVTDFLKRKGSPLEPPDTGPEPGQITAGGAVRARVT